MVAPVRRRPARRASSPRRWPARPTSAPRRRAWCARRRWSTTARGAELPHVDFDASVKRELLSRNGLFPPPYGGSIFNQSNATFGLKWDADLFGRQKADIEAALGSARAAQADADVAAQQIATQVVRTYFSLARLESQRAVAQRTYDQRKQMLSLISQRVSAGLDTVVEQKQGEGALPDTLAQIESLDEQIDLTRHMLAALTAQPMDALATLAPTLDQLHVSPQPPVLGADLIARRPDVAAALARVEAAKQQVEVAARAVLSGHQLLGRLRARLDQPEATSWSCPARRGRSAPRCTCPSSKAASCAPSSRARAPTATPRSRPTTSR